jgi:hypothetical protein
MSKAANPKQRSQSGTPKAANPQQPKRGRSKTEDPEWRILTDHPPPFVGSCRVLLEVNVVQVSHGHQAVQYQKQKCLMVEISIALMWLSAHNLIETTQQVQS